jgi:hypothetical protein
MKARKWVSQRGTDFKLIALTASILRRDPTSARRVRHHRLRYGESWVRVLSRPEC